VKYKEKNIQQLVPHVMDDSYKSKNISSLVGLLNNERVICCFEGRKSAAAVATKRIEQTCL
jgi:hypothetical protein